MKPKVHIALEWRCRNRFTLLGIHRSESIYSKQTSRRPAEARMAKMSFEQILRTQQVINSLSRSLIGRPALEDVHVLLPDPRRPEPGFMRAVSWLYCLYYEGGRVSITFLRRLGEVYGLVDRDKDDAHVEIVRCLRTELHHNLGFADSDQRARTAAEIWRRNACGTVLPEKDEQWRQCYERLVEDASTFLRGLEEVVRCVEVKGDGAAREMSDWKRRLDRNWLAADLDPLIEDAKYRLGRQSLHTIRFRNRHVDKWRKLLDYFEDGFDFEREATLLIEKTLLDEGGGILPITAGDIIRELGVKPGPVVGSLLEEVKRFYETNKCTADELLEHIRGHYKQTLYTGA